MKKTAKRLNLNLHLHAETVRALTTTDLNIARGGYPTRTAAGTECPTYYPPGDCDSGECTASCAFCNTAFTMCQGC